LPYVLHQLEPLFSNYFSSRLVVVSQKPNKC
jgi:hypothetical protein